MCTKLGFELSVAKTLSLTELQQLTQPFVHALYKNTNQRWNNPIAQ